MSICFMVVYSRSGGGGDTADGKHFAPRMPRLRVRKIWGKCGRGLAWHHGTLWGCRRLPSRVRPRRPLWAAWVVKGAPDDDDSWDSGEFIEMWPCELIRNELIGLLE